MYDVIIIGAGVIGCAVAREISRYKLKTLVIEKADDAAQGASKANSGIVHSGVDAKNGSNKAKFNVRGNSMFDELCRELDVHFVRNGSLIICFDENEIERLYKLKENGEKNGVENLEIIESARLHEMEPNVSQKAAAALYAPSGGIVCPYDLTISMAESAYVNGVEFRFDTCVESIKKENGMWHLNTNNGTFDSKVIVNCAGVHADEINNAVSEEKIQIVARKGEYRMVDKRYRDYFKRTIFQLPTDMGKGVLVSPTVDGTLIIGPTALDIEDKDDVSTDSEMLSLAVSTAMKTWEALPTGSLITTFAGVRAHSVADDFIIGEREDADGFFNAAGIESPGLSSAPAIGVYLAEAISKKLSAEKKDSFVPIRPKAKRFREMTNQEREQAIRENSEYARIVCRCEQVTAAEIRDAIRRPLGAKNLDGVKRRTRAGMGRCQGGFCMPTVVDILCEELNLTPEQVSKFGGNSYILSGRIGGGSKND